MLEFRQQHEPSPYDGIPTPGAHLSARPHSSQDTQSLRSSADSSAGSLSDGLSTADRGLDDPDQAHTQRDDGAPARQSTEAEAAAGGNSRHVKPSVLPHKDAALAAGMGLSKVNA